MEWIKGVSCIISIAVVVGCTIWNAGRYQTTGMGEEPAAKQGSVGGWFRYSGPTRPTTDHNQLTAHLQSVTPPVWDWRTHPPRLKIGLRHATWKGEQVERGGRWNPPPTKDQPASLTCDYMRPCHRLPGRFPRLSELGVKIRRVTSGTACSTLTENKEDLKVRKTLAANTAIWLRSTIHSHFPHHGTSPGLGINRGACCAPRMHVCRVPISEYTVIGLPEGPYLTFGLQVAGHSRAGHCSASAINPSLTHFTHPQS